MRSKILSLFLAVIGAGAAASAQAPDFVTPGQHPALLLTPASARQSFHGLVCILSVRQRGSYGTPRPANHFHTRNPIPVAPTLML